MENILTILKSFLIKLKSFLVFLFSLENPKSRLFMIFISLLFLFLIPTNYLESFPSLSVYENLGLYDFLGFEFYSSGITRSISSILHLNFFQAFEYNPLGFVFLFVLLGIIIRDVVVLFKEFQNSKF